MAPENLPPFQVELGNLGFPEVDGNAFQSERALFGPVHAKKRGRRATRDTLWGDACCRPQDLGLARSRRLA